MSDVTKPVMLDETGKNLANLYGQQNLILSQLVSAVEAISGGGTVITDGVVVQSKDANGYPTDIDYYGDLGEYSLGASRGDTDHYLGKLESVTFKNTITDIPNYAFRNGACRGNGISAMLSFPDVVSVGEYAFENAHIQGLSFPALESVGNTSLIFYNSLISELYLPKLTSLSQSNGSYGMCRSCTSLTYAQFGSVGYTAPNNVMQQFRGCSQTSLTVCIYCLGDAVDTILSTLRTGVTSGTIIFKASEATTYNGTAYAAGDTILTSEVT